MCNHPTPALATEIHYQLAWYEIPTAKAIRAQGNAPLAVLIPHAWQLAQL